MADRYGGVQHPLLSTRYLFGPHPYDTENLSISELPKHEPPLPAISYEVLAVQPGGMLLFVVIGFVL